TSTHPVKRFWAFHVLSPWRSNTSRYGAPVMWAAYSRLPFTALRGVSDADRVLCGDDEDQASRHGYGVVTDALVVAAQQRDVDRGLDSPDGLLPLVAQQRLEHRPPQRVHLVVGVLEL